MGIPVKLEAFEGPLDLLLHLIDKDKINIYDIPIVQVTEQYMDYIRQLNRKDMEVMSEFLVMAATLLRIKSEMLLPKEEKEQPEEGDPRQELVERLLEYKMYKYIALELKDKQMEASYILFKGSTLPPNLNDYNSKVDVSELLSGLTLSKLHRIFQSVIKRQEDKVDPVRSKFGRIEKEEINLSEKILGIQKYGLKNRHFSFRTYLEGCQGKMDVIVTFLGILELMKMGRLAVSQRELFEDIEIDYLAQDIAPVEQFA